MLADATRDSLIDRSSRTVTYRLLVPAIISVTMMVAALIGQCIPAIYIVACGVLLFGLIWECVYYPIYMRASRYRPMYWEIASSVINYDTAECPCCGSPAAEFGVNGRAAYIKCQCGTKMYVILSGNPRLSGGRYLITDGYEYGDMCAHDKEADLI